MPKSKRYTAKQIAVGALAGIILASLTLQIFLRIISL